MERRYGYKYVQSNATQRQPAIIDSRFSLVITRKHIGLSNATRLHLEACDENS